MKKTTTITGTLVALGLIATLGTASTASAFSLGLRGEADASTIIIYLRKITFDYCNIKPK